MLRVVCAVIVAKALGALVCVVAVRACALAILKSVAKTPALTVVGKGAIRDEMLTGLCSDLRCLLWWLASG